MKIYFEEDDINNMWNNLEYNTDQKIRIHENNLRHATRNTSIDKLKTITNEIEELREHKINIQRIRKEFKYELNATIKQ